MSDTRDKSNWHSSRFKTKEDQEWHTRTQFHASRSVDESRAKYIRETFGLQTQILTTHSIRITDGKKKLDLYDRKYFKVDTKERGSFSWHDDEAIIKMITEYFGISGEAI